MLLIVSRFSTEKSSKLGKVHTFQKKNATNDELNIFFLNKVEEDFLR